MKGQGSILQKEGAAAWITVDCSVGGDTADLEVAAALDEACREASWDHGVRVVLLTGVGKRFCVRSPTAPGPDAEEQMAQLRLAAPVAALEKPVIAVLNGSAIGQGLELALACDLRITVPEARFAMPHVQNGLVPWDGGTQRFPRVVGRARALELLLTGREIEAPEALAMGLVHQIIPGGELRHKAQELAERLAAHAPIAVRYTKEAVYQGVDMDLAAGLRLEADLNVILQSTRDRAEGAQSFRERREPRFQGR